MNDINLRNHPSLIFNYLVYLSNILRNKSTNSPKYFPLDGPLFFDSLDLKKAWEIGIAKYSEDSAAIIDGKIESDSSIHEILFPEKKRKA